MSSQRLPIELTSLGRAHLATTCAAQRKASYDVFTARRGAQWPTLLAKIEQSTDCVRESGFCAASWQPEVVALASPIVTAAACYWLNVSVPTVENMEAMEALRAPLLDLRDAFSSSI